MADFIMFVIYYALVAFGQILKGSRGASSHDRLLENTALKVAHLSSDHILILMQALFTPLATYRTNIQQPETNSLDVGSDVLEIWLEPCFSQRTICFMICVSLEFLT